MLPSMLTHCAAFLWSLTVPLHYTVLPHSVYSNSIHPSIDVRLVIAAFELGTLGTNACAASSALVDTEAACILAVDALPATDEFPSRHNQGFAVAVHSFADRPKGCFLENFALVFNTHPTGAANAINTPICASKCSRLRF